MMYDCLVTFYDVEYELYFGTRTFTSSFATSQRDTRSGCVDRIRIGDASARLT